MSIKGDGFILRGEKCERLTEILCYERKCRRDDGGIETLQQEGGKEAQDDLPSVDSATVLVCFLLRHELRFLVFRLGLRLFSGGRGVVVPVDRRGRWCLETRGCLLCRYISGTWFRSVMQGKLYRVDWGCCWCLAVSMLTLLVLGPRPAVCENHGGLDTSLVC